MNIFSERKDLMKKTAKTVSLLCVVAMLFSFAGCFDVQIRITDPNSGSSVNDTVTQTPVTQISATEAPATSAPEQTTASEFTTAAPVGTEEKTEAATEKVTEKTTEKTTEKAKSESADTSVTPDKMDVEALLDYFNNTLNKVKSDSVGFTKSKLTSILDLQLSNSAANSVVGIVKSALLSETTDVTTVAKGESSVDVMSPSGQTFVSRMNMGDIEGITCEKDGANYVITATIVPQTNPEKTTGVMSDIFDFMTVDDVLDTYAPKVGATVAREDIVVDFSDCYAKLTVDANGKIQKYETYVKGVMNMNNASIKKVVTISTDVAVTLASKTEYTDFSY